MFTNSTSNVINKQLFLVSLGLVHQCQFKITCGINCQSEDLKLLQKVVLIYLTSALYCL